MNSFKANPWIHSPLPDSDALLRLFCFPYAGGGAAVYRRWSEALPATVDVCPVLLPGREARLSEPSISSVFPLVDALAPAIIPVLDRPFVFFGHSMGSLVAFELARKLRRERNLLPECLYVSARVAPCVALKSQPLSTLPEDEFIQALARFNGSEKGVLQHAELMKLMIPTLRADFALHEDYRYMEEPALECPIVVFGGLQDLTTDKQGLNAWRHHTNRPLVQRMFAGDHFFINTQQSLFLSSLSQELQRILASLRREPASRCVTGQTA
ncbi:MAG: thioesterase II family protein [Candidatus Angelobacter sp.]